MENLLQVLRGSSQEVRGGQRQQHWQRIFPNHGNSLLRGRDFNSQVDDQRVAIVNEVTGVNSSYGAGVSPCRFITSAMASRGGGPPAAAFNTAAISRK